MRVGIKNWPGFKKVLSNLLYHFGGLQEMATAKKGDAR